MRLSLPRLAVGPGQSRLHSVTFRMAKQDAARVEITVLGATKEGRMRFSFLGSNGGEFVSAGPDPVEVDNTVATAELEYTGVPWAFLLVLFEAMSESMAFAAQFTTYQTGVAPASSSAPPRELELGPLLMVDGRVAKSLDLVLDGATGVEIVIEPVPTLGDRAMLVGLEVAPMPAESAEAAWEPHDEVPVLPGAEGFRLAIPLPPHACCARLVARFDGEPDAASPARALVRARWTITGAGDVEVRASLRLNGWTLPMGPWPRVALGTPPDPSDAPAFGGSLYSALQRLRTAP